MCEFAVLCVGTRVHVCSFLGISPQAVSGWIPKVLALAPLDQQVLLSLDVGQDNLFLLSQDCSEGIVGLAVGFFIIIASF